MLWHDESGVEIGGRRGPISRRSGDCSVQTAQGAGTIVRSHSTPQQLAMRARVILHALDGVGVRESGRELDV